MNRYLKYAAVAVVSVGIGYTMADGVDEDHLISGGSHVNGIFPMPDADTAEWKRVMLAAGDYCDIIMNASAMPVENCERFFAARIAEVQARMAAHNEKG